MPTWVKIAVISSNDESTRICEAFDALGAISVVIENAGASLEFDEFQPNAPAWRLQLISGLFDSECESETVIRTLHNIAGAKKKITCTKILDRDWVINSQKAVQPFQLSNDLWICPNWSTPPADNAKIIWITPGLAFGTGHHPSTALCLQKLVTLDLRKTVVLDWGCGSGILSIVAVALGADRATAVDIDHHALTASHNHAKINKLDDRLTICRPEELPDGMQYQLIVANLLASSLIKLANTFGRYLGSGGKLLLSGVLEDQVSQVISAFGRRYSFESTSHDGWAMITASCKHMS